MSTNSHIFKIADVKNSSQIGHTGNNLLK